MIVLVKGGGMASTLAPATPFPSWSTTLPMTRSGPRDSASTPPSASCGRSFTSKQAGSYPCAEARSQSGEDPGESANRNRPRVSVVASIRGRYERGSLVLTSNRAVEEWYPLFKDELMASVAMARLLHRAHVVVMEGHSVRNPPQTHRAS